jgi:hypothetical protein
VIVTNWCRAAAFAAIMLMQPATGAAQDWPSPAWAIFKQVVFDPTTYAPAVVSYAAERLDWQSSQVFFQHGFLEANAQFTVSGRPDDTPVSYAAGNRIIVDNALRDLAASAFNNTLDRIIERVLIRRYPNHEKLLRTVGWIERVTFATTLATVQSAQHWRQWRGNERLARELGYR